MNHQVVTDWKHGLIVSSDVVKESNDLRQLSKQIDKANESLDKPCKIAVGDAGYSSATECEKLVQKGIEVIVPSQKRASHKKEKKKQMTPLIKAISNMIKKMIVIFVLKEKF